MGDRDQGSVCSVQDQVQGSAGWGPESELSLGSFRIQSTSGIKEKPEIRIKTIQGQDPGVSLAMEPSTRRWFILQSSPGCSTWPLAQPPSCLREPPAHLQKPPAHLSPLGRLQSHLWVHPPGQVARIPRSICLLSCRGNRARQTGPSPSPSGACLQTVGVRGSATQPPSWAHTAESKRRPLLSSSQPPSTPQMGRDHAVPACLLPQALLTPCQGPRGRPTAQAYSPGGQAGQGKGRALGII